MVGLLISCALSVVPPAGCSKGVLWRRHDGESGDDSNTVEERIDPAGMPYTNDTFDIGYWSWDGRGIVDESATWRGSFCAPKSGNYSFYVNAKPGGCLWFDGEKSNFERDNKRCDAEHSEGKVGKYLNVHTCYPFKGWLKSGCNSIHDDRFRVVVTIDGVDYTSSNDTVTCEKNECEGSYYGPNCLPCPNCHSGYCLDGMSGTGKCVCDNGGESQYNCGPSPSFTASAHFTPNSPSPTFTQAVVMYMVRSGHTRLIRRIGAFVSPLFISM